jgi:hypothetical protein
MRHLVSFAGLLAKQVLSRRACANHQEFIELVGFNASEERLNMSKTLDIWLMVGDERLFKIIVSPELGDRLNVSLPKFRPSCETSLQPEAKEIWLTFACW